MVAVVAAVLVSLMFSPAAPAAAAPRAEADVHEVATISNVCLQGHVENVGWQDWSCQSTSGRARAGVTGRALQLEAVNVYIEDSGFCVRAHVRNDGWHDWLCLPNGGTIQVGTTGRNLPMEAIEIEDYDTGGRYLCSRGHQRNYGWSSEYCLNGASMFIGSTGGAIELEAVELWVQ